MVNANTKTRTSNNIDKYNNLHLFAPMCVYLKLKQDENIKLFIYCCKIHTLMLPLFLYVLTHTHTHTLTKYNHNNEHHTLFLLLFYYILYNLKSPFSFTYIRHVLVQHHLQLLCFTFYFTHKVPHIRATVVVAVRETPVLTLCVCVFCE